jgi:hypothetical protein
MFRLELYRPPGRPLRLDRLYAYRLQRRTVPRQDGQRAAATAGRTTLPPTASQKEVPPQPLARGCVASLFQFIEKRNEMKISQGKYVIVRTYSAGVFAGVLEARNGREVELSNARRLWYWRGAASLSELAMKGVSRPTDCKFPAPVETVLLLEAIEILPVTSAAQKSIEGVTPWTA